MSLIDIGIPIVNGIKCSDISKIISATRSGNQVDIRCITGTLSFTIHQEDDFQMVDDFIKLVKEHKAKDLMHGKVVYYEILS